MQRLRQERLHLARASLRIELRSPGTPQIAGVRILPVVRLRRPGIAPLTPRTLMAIGPMQHRLAALLVRAATAPPNSEPTSRILRFNARAECSDVMGAAKGRARRSHRTLGPTPKPHSARSGSAMHVTIAPDRPAPPFVDTPSHRAALFPCSIRDGTATHPARRSSWRIESGRSTTAT